MDATEVARRLRQLQQEQQMEERGLLRPPPRDPGVEAVKSELPQQAAVATPPEPPPQGAPEQAPPQKPEAAISPVPDLAALGPEDAKRLRQKYEGGGHTQTMSYEDWLDANFAVSDVDAMRAAARSTPRIQAGKDPDLLPGENSATAKSRIAAGKPLPEGRDSSQYTAGQRRTMSRNVHSPEVPMTRFGGTFTHNVDGSVSSRAPNPEMLRIADEIAADPQQGKGSQSHILALAQAYGIDAQKYGDDMDMLKADVMREQQRHDRIAKAYDIEDNGMGGFHYKYNRDRHEQSLAERDAGMSRRRKQEFASTIRNRYGDLMTPEQRVMMAAAIETPEGFSQLRDVQDGLRAQDMEVRNRNVRNNWANINMTIAANNPAKAQGLYMRSLQEAARSGDPLQVAAVHESFGNDRAARAYIDLAGRQAEAASVAVASEANARGKSKDAAPAVPLAESFAKEVNAALQIADPRQRKLAVMAILTKSEFLPPEEVTAQADAIIASAAGGTLPPQHVQSWWQLLFGPAQPQQGPAAPPAPAAPAPPATPAEAPAAPAPPASGRGASLDATMEWLRGNKPSLNPNHPFSRRGPAVP